MSVFFTVSICCLMSVILRQGILFYASGRVVHGFGRGSKKLGIPTANLEEAVVARLPDAIKTGIYFGWARVDDGPVYKAVVSIGLNPYFKNSKRSFEAHLLHQFDEDFYDSFIQLVILKYHRPERDFESLDALIRCIHEDIQSASRYLDLPMSVEWTDLKHFRSGSETNREQT
ncbi:Riboflavin kinase [Fasciola gigantica]|uniref:riboflavin kinase n=1 Tax=Fasciola gigantica TaxID=46835 RepID=A0A504YVM7_FASGI|nr:Riboflavin kinase [Fasciola gigantica]